VPLIDERGRLFGKVNLIDGAVALLVLVLIPLAYGAFLLFRAPVPKIVSVEPAQVVQQRGASVQLTGQDLRPFLRARFNGFESPGFLVQSPTLAEIKLPALPPGTYDLILFDEAQELARKPGALTVLTTDAVPLPPSLATLRVRFFAESDVLAVMKAHDVDVGGAATLAEKDRATLEEVGSDRRTVSVEIYTEGFLGKNLRFQQPMQEFTATIRVPIQFKPTGWSYKDRPVKVGAPLTFETMMGAMTGWIQEMKLSADAVSVKP
jgi:hypothetical protein